MNLRLEELPAHVYAHQILPLTEPVWALGRTFDVYRAQTLELAHTTYGRRHFRTFALVDDDSAPLASFKRYERDARTGTERLRAIGIGAVFTPREYRGQGYASAMLGLALDCARSEGFDFAYLFSDIYPQFYKDLGFVELPSRSISLRADRLRGDRITVHALSERDWPEVRRCFSACDEERGFGLTRSPDGVELDSYATASESRTAARATRAAGPAARQVGRGLRHRRAGAGARCVRYR